MLSMRIIGFNIYYYTFVTVSNPIFIFLSRRFVEKRSNILNYIYEKQRHYLRHSYSI